MDGAGLYACPFDLKGGKKFFDTNCFGFYSWVVGINLSSNLGKYALPELTKYCSPEEAVRLRKSFENNWKGISVLDSDLYVPMFGYDSIDDYYSHGTVAGHLHKIKVPTFCLSANDD